MPGSSSQLAIFDQDGATFPEPDDKLVTELVGKLKKAEASVLGKHCFFFWGGGGLDDVERETDPYNSKGIYSHTYNCFIVMVLLHHQGKNGLEQMVWHKKLS